MNLQEAKKWSKHIDKEDLSHDKFPNKFGFAYLNAIFFDRHKKYFSRKITIRCLIFAAIPVASAIFVIFSYFEYNMWINPLRENIPLEQLFQMAPIFFFIIYIASMGRVTTASVFSSCDIQMLHYPYYQKRDTIFASFKSRFILILRYNFIITTVIFITMTLGVLIIYGTVYPHYVILLFVLLTAIGVLFAFNDLFLYYVIQPYDSDGKGKSIVYQIINFVIYVIAWQNMTMHFEFVSYTIIVTVVTLVYLGVGTVLLLNLAPKRFRLR